MKTHLLIPLCLALTTSSSLSFGYNVDKQNEFESVVWVCVKTAKGKGCGSGIVVGDNVIITAGHGGIRVKKPSDTLTVIVGKRTFYAERIIIHPDFTPAVAVTEKAREAFLKLPAKSRENYNFSSLSEPEKVIAANSSTAHGKMQSVDIAIVYLKAPKGLGIPAAKLVLPAREDATDANALHLARELRYDITKSIGAVGAGYGNANCKFDYKVGKWKPCSTLEGVRRWDTVKPKVIRPEFNVPAESPLSAFLIELTTDSGVSPNHPGDSGGALLLKFSDGSKVVVGVLVGGDEKRAKAVSLQSPSVARFLHANLPQTFVPPPKLIGVHPPPATPTGSFQVRP